MDNSNDNFNELQKLLALKRREQPPQQFFRGFAGHVRDHIHDPAPARPLSWSERFGFDSPFRPVWICGMGVFLCGLLALGTIYARQVKLEDKQKAAATLAEPVLPVASPPNAAWPEAASPVAGRSSIEPVFSAGTSTLERLQLKLPVQKAGFPAASSNR